MEATAAVACRGGGVLARASPGHRARRPGVGGGAGARPVARRRLHVVASLGETPSAPARNAVAVAQEATAALPTPTRKEIPIAQVDEDEDDVSSAAILPPPTNLPSPDNVNTVRVKFVLEKQCAFGQRFLVVGDDPALGLWDPAKASALDRSDGDVWTARTDLPANKLVEFKFLLQDPSGQVRWQHGDNRALRITEAANTLVVYEDWDDAECQKVSEEMDHLSIGAGETIFAGSKAVLLMLADDTQIDEDQEADQGLMHAASEASLRRQNMGVNGANRSQFTLGKGDKVPDELRRRANSAAQNGSSLASAAGINGDDIILYEGGAPVENRPATAGVFENDMFWIRKSLQGWRQSLGFLIGTTKTWK